MSAEPENSSKNKVVDIPTDDVMTAIAQNLTDTASENGRYIGAVESRMIVTQVIRDLADNGYTLKFKPKK